MSFKDFFSKLKKNLEAFFIKVIHAVKQSFIKATKGEENFNIMLWCWGLIPGLAVLIFVQEYLERRFSGRPSILIYLFLMFFFLWHAVSIRTTLKKHPEYRVKKENKKNKYKNLSRKEIKELRQKERKEKSKELVQKALLIRPWKTMEFYKFVFVMDCVIIVFEASRILYIISR